MGNIRNYLTSNKQYQLYLQETPNHDSSNKAFDQGFFHRIESQNMELYSLVLILGSLRHLGHVLRLEELGIPLADQDLERVRGRLLIGRRISVRRRHTDLVFLAEFEWLVALGPYHPALLIHFKAVLSS